MISLVSTSIPLHGRQIKLVDRMTQESKKRKTPSGLSKHSFYIV